jgi:hypothetical protein
VRKRHLLLVLGLLASAAAALWLPTPSTEVVHPVARAASTQSAPLVQMRIPAQPGLLRLAPRIAAQEGAPTPFTVPAWALPKSPAIPAESATSAAAEQAPAQAPPAPFKVIGRYEEGGKPPGFFLEYQQKSMIARSGDQLTPEWKVESAEASRIVLQYLPLSQRQTLE